MTVLVVVGVALLVLLAGWRVRPWHDRRPTRRSAPTAARWWPAERPWRRRNEMPLAECLNAIARELRGGGTVTAAFLAGTGAPSVSPALQQARRQVAEGVPLGIALEQVRPATRTPPGERADLELTRHTLACAVAVGGSSAIALDAAAAVLRERAAVADDARAHSAQARLSGRVLTVVPLAFAAWTMVTDERARRTYTASTVGAACVIAGLMLNGAGWLWMRRIVHAGGGGR